MSDRRTIQTRVKALPTEIQDIICRFQHNLAFKECVGSIKRPLYEIGFTCYNSPQEFSPNHPDIIFREPRGSGSYIIEKVLKIWRVYIEIVEDRSSDTSLVRYQNATDESNDANVENVIMYEMQCYDPWANYRSYGTDPDRDYIDYHEPGDEDSFGVHAFRLESELKGDWKDRGFKFRVFGEFCLHDN
jgi:hypothetical protein